MKSFSAIASVAAVTNAWGNDYYYPQPQISYRPVTHKVGYDTHKVKAGYDTQRVKTGYDTKQVKTGYDTK